MWLRRVEASWINGGRLKRWMFHKLLFAARAAGASDLPGMKAAVRQATRISRPLDWRASGAYGDGPLPVAAESGSRNARYDEAFEIVRAIGMLRARLDERAEFTSELEEIRAAYRAKRNFIKLLSKLA